MNTKRILFWGTLAAGVAAAILMRRRGESIGKIAWSSVTNPVGSLISEVKTTQA